MNLRRIILMCLLATAVPTMALGADYTIKAGSTDVTAYVTLYHAGDSNLDAGPITGVTYNSPGLKVYYIRPGGDLTQVSTVTQTVTGAHADGGWIQLSGTNAPGRYRLDLPDEVCQAGASHARVSVYMATGTGHVVDDIDIELVGYDPTAAALPANITLVNGDSTAAQNAERFFDGRGYGCVLQKGTVGTVASQTFFSIASNEVVENQNGYRGCTIVIRNAINKSIRTIVESGIQEIGEYVMLDSAPDFTIQTDDVIEILAPGFVYNDRLNAMATKANTAAAAGGYNNVLEVGDGKEYESIADAKAAASAGDLIMLYPGNHYTNGDIFKTGVYIYAARGATLLTSGSLSDDPSVIDCGLLGHARITSAEGTEPFGFSESDVFLTNHGGTTIIEFDEWNVLNGQAVEHNGGRTIIRGNLLVSAGSLGCLTVNGSGLRAEIGELQANRIVELGATGAFAEVSVNRATITGEDLVTGQAARAIIRGVYESTHASSNGISAPAGATIWLAPSNRL